MTLFRVDPVSFSFERKAGCSGFEFGMLLSHNRITLGVACSTRSWGIVSYGGEAYGVRVVRAETRT